ncbi:MAG: hypothetical protein WCT31_05425 [Candidatus Micrarchaeia archaeon]
MALASKTGNPELETTIVRGAEGASTKALAQYALVKLSGTRAAHSLSRNEG